jgi:class 3 adenylate cyclase/tetratricopeptide (TPR) repeat protein
MGQPVQTVERPENRSQSRAGERRHLTVLFCDLVGSTEIAARLDPEEWQETVAAYHRAAADAIGQFGGHVAKYLGDGVMAYFGYPEAHDNDAERAARAGLAILEAITWLNEQPPPPLPSPMLNNGGGNIRPKLSVRVGIDSGAVVVGAGAGVEIDVFGEAPNIAARVQGAAAPDTVLLSAATHRLVAGLFVIEDCGGQALKGVEQPMHLYRVIQPAGVRGRLAAAAASRGLTPFVGREDELRTLTSRCQRVIDGEGQVVLIVGEAGIGKSRLVQQFHQQIAGTPHTWVEAAAAPFYQNTPFYPVAEALWQLVWEQSLNRFGDYLRELQGGEYRSNTQSAPLPSPSPVSKKGGGDRDTSPRTDFPPPLSPMGEGQGGGAERLDELQSGLIAAGLKPAEAIPLIAPLLNLPLSTTYAPSSLSPEQQRRRLLATLIEWLLGAAQAQPLVIVIEDLHWADPSTLELIQLLAEQGATARMLLLYTARPEFRAEGPLRAHHTQITLNRLSAHNVREMIAQVAARNALANETLDAVVERTSGVPLFVEELTRVVLESADTKLTDRAIPVTLHDSLMARLDRLGSAKEALQIGSVIGSEFSYELLHAVHSLSDEDLQRELRRLTDADLLYVRGLPPDATYQFKHALIRDAAYEALLKSRRRELHRLVAHTLEEQFLEVKEAHPEVLARHWSEAGEPEPAVAEWSKAARAAQARSAFQEALESSQHALEQLILLPESPERDRRELELRQAVVQILWVMKGEATSEFVRAIQLVAALAEKTGDLGQIVNSIIVRQASAFIAGDLPNALSLADQALELALRDGNPVNLGLVYMIQTGARFHRGDLEGSERHFSAGHEYFDNPAFRQFQDGVVRAFGFASLNAWALGRADIARARLARLTAEVTGNNAWEAGASKLFATMFQLNLRDYARAEELAAQLMKHAEKNRLALMAAQVAAFLGYARAYLGRTTEGIALIRQGIAGNLKLGSHVTIAECKRYLAEALALEDHLDEALATVEQAFSEDPHETIYRPEILRVRGELRLKWGQIELAKTDLHEAIALAHMMSAKSYELRATMSLARLLDQQGHRDEARAILTEIYNWFTEGFDTPDLMDAKVILIELGA